MSDAGAVTPVVFAAAAVVSAKKLFAAKFRVKKFFQKTEKEA
jgi:hypothetical protein